jgi:hypothetical protein
VSSLWIALAIGATLLTWRKKEALLREWVFWGLFVFFLSYQYHKSVQSTVEQYWAQFVSGLMGFFTISIWLLWLNYSSVGKLLKSFRGRISEKGTVVIMGASSGSWWSACGELCGSTIFGPGSNQLHLFKGSPSWFPLILYHLVGREYLKLTPSKDLRWGWILLLGIGLVQVLQGIEHAWVAWVENVRFDIFQKQLYQGVLNGIPLDQLAPLWVKNPSWVLVWRFLRWWCVMGFLPWVVPRSDQSQRPKPVLLLNACFLSLAVWTAEATWIFWPFMPLEWAVVLRPWTERLMWDVYPSTVSDLLCCKSPWG